MAADVAQVVGAGSPPGPQAIYRLVRAGERLFQGEVIEGIVEWHAAHDTADPIPMRVVGAEGKRHNLAIVLTQDCDLEQDWFKRSKDTFVNTDLPSVLLCPAGPAEVRFEEEGITGNDRRKPIRNNKNERYQYLAEVTKDLDQTGEGLAPLLVDFKSLFTLRTIEIYRQLRVAAAEAPRRRCRLETPWTEHLQVRFAMYHGRIGLPRDHFVPVNRRAEAASDGPT